MIRYTLKCDNDHRFESWFQSAEAFETVRAQGFATCPDCGSAKVEKTLMAPTVRPARKAAQPVASANAEPPAQPMSANADADVAEAVKKLKEHIEKNSEYVGDRFAREARAMHEGESPQRAIYGEARPEEARKLAEDGIPALPLPFIPRQKTN
ncbi:DUF1178 family protein [Alphaproteobacteria bacterium GH1-50]|uniref:DUF1178 family protein n=1 Tax=Kangsaoukella pontilimi TaxID=2691042 RepID=A0A7C9IE27_9RHOB|nr:DUF1178 family protein [Kangsaoukella pontilimi]MXQ06407.1 DUF1178 family protein [Kangsaoukella pontilimi]